ncbi:hypothetical protein TeGR_g4362 [Tetraparma gracilis]|uniref:Sodium/calcium exchanger membrane region domain-containing protein n=1 Tax=Tetraparma gracilis TaxID=2962635 RepID=A0ABQ6N9E8_9STRA|nr:hypothetical protein TeGR_g4362 [Tetraparma gracilis]
MVSLSIDADDEPKEAPKGVLDDGIGVYLKRSLGEVLFGTKLNILGLCIPLAFIAKHQEWDQGYIFAFSLLAIAPIAERIGFVTEQLALYTNPTIGGLLNASMGNITELIICIIAIKTGELRVVQLSLLGSILSNLMLVLGCAFLAGGMRHPIQNFNKSASSTNASLLMLAVLCLVLPSALQTSGGLGSDEAEALSKDLELSRFSSVLMLLVYAATIIFQLKTHTHLFDEEDDEDEESILGFWGAMFWMAVITVLLAFLSEFLVVTIKGASESYGISSYFLTTIVLPIVGNAAEHAAAVVMAYKNKMEISMGVAVGSATQIALFVIPACVVVGWAADVDLDLDFSVFDTMAMVSSVLVVVMIIQHGESHWLHGLMLVTAYIIVAGAYWVHVDESLE